MIPVLFGALAFAAIAAVCAFAVAVSLGIRLLRWRAS